MAYAGYECVGIIVFDERAFIMRKLVVSSIVLALLLMSSRLLLGYAGVRSVTVLSGSGR